MRLHTGAGKLTGRTPTTCLFHCKRSPVACYADEDLISRNTCFGDHGQRLRCLGQVDLAAKAVGCVVALLGVIVVGVPLTVEIVRHVHDIVDDLVDVLDWKLLQVSVRGRGGNCDCLSGQ